jgi:hypothetical protein
MVYKQLADEQRYQIEALKREGFTQECIAIFDWKITQYDQSRAKMQQR